MMLYLHEHHCPLPEAIGGNENLAVVQWLHGHGCPWNEGSYWRAAERGNLETILWSQDHVGVTPIDTICRHAVERGYLNIIEHFQDYISSNAPIFARLAIEYGRLDVLQWIYAHDYIVLTNCFAEARRYNRPEIVRWLETIPEFYRPSGLFSS